METYFYKKEVEPISTGPTELESYFSKDISSIHLRENTTPMAKKGTPGHIELIELDYVPLRYRDLDRISKEIIEQSKKRQVLELRFLQYGLY